MKSLAVKTSEIVRYASKNVVMNGSDSITATAKAMELATLKARMMRGEVCKFAYLKLDNTVRIATGVLGDAAAYHIKGTGIPKRYYGMFVYLDLERLDFRGFKEERFLGCIEC